MSEEIITHHDIENKQLKEENEMRMTMTMTMKMEK